MSIFDIFAHAVVISRKTVKSAENTSSIILVNRTRGDTSFLKILLIQL